MLYVYGVVILVFFLTSLLLFFKEQKFAYLVFATFLSAFLVLTFANTVVVSNAQIVKIYDSTMTMISVVIMFVMMILTGLYYFYNVSRRL